MYKAETKIRVRYGETDQMGVVYYGVYAMYYEVGRVESLRQLGLSYRQLEETGILLPVLENFSRYWAP
ncbi:MAG: thioesterase, partial [Candidatus Nephrothrix sp. EaCA]